LNHGSESYLFMEMKPESMNGKGRESLQILR
jgi:hypothetical protein